MASMREFFNKNKDSRGQPVSWQRFDLDGAPFRGQAPLLTEQEYENRVRRTRDAHAEFFDITDAKKLKAYLRVLDGIVNGIYQMMYIKRFIKPNTHYVEWVEVYMEDSGGSS
jgi:hypothetical protein